MNTRFNPGTNGPLHIGHIYMVLLNEAVAHSNNGEFTLRFHDNGRGFPGYPESQAANAKGMLQDLDWMGVTIDKVIYQSEEEAAIRAFLATSPHFRYAIPGNFFHETAPLPLDRLQTGPVDVWQLAEGVVGDGWLGVTDIIRGVELLAFHSLYVYLCSLLGFSFPRWYYMPRLMAPASEELSAGYNPNTFRSANVSKTVGNWQVQDLRNAGVTPAQVRLILRRSCLKDPDGRWTIDNIKSHPTLVVRSLAECREHPPYIPKEK